jgi:hypothetical protein
MQLYNKKHFFLFYLLLSIGLYSCGAYSFSPASINPDIKTIAVPLFGDRTGTGPANLSRRFTEKTRDYYQRNTKLSVVNTNGDLQLECYIVNYTFSPAAPTAATESASQMRLNITVEATYTNNKNPDENFEKKQFAFFADFPSDRQQSAEEPRLIEEISDQIILQMFNQTVANW